MTQDELRRAVSVNLTHLRRAAGMTQAHLAERINYTDKAVSKWERGESVPDVAVLKTLADLFGVTVDYLITEKHGEDAYYPLAELKRKRVNRAVIIGMGLLGVWFLAVVAFMGIDFFNPDIFWAWLVFIYAVPVSLVTWLVLNSVWFRGRGNTFLISGLIWSLLCSLHLTVLYFGYQIGLIYILGAPAQVIVLLSTRVRVTRPKEEESVTLEEVLEEEDT